MTPPTTPATDPTDKPKHKPTRLVVDPRIDPASVTTRNGRDTPIIATGHQPFFWHPGILAKDIAAASLAKRIGGLAVHVVVEHNALPPLSIDLPTQQAGRLGVRRLVLDDRPASATTPPNRLPALDAARTAERIHAAAQAPEIQAIAGLRPRLELLARAYAQQADHPHLAAQTSAVLDTLRRPYAGELQALPTNALVTPGFLERLLADPVRCVRDYNREARAYPRARIRPLYAGRDVVEAPLWAQHGAGPTPVYIDLGDSRRPQLFTHAKPGREAIDLTGPDALVHLRPRALTLSAIMRSERCDLFIHGTGGGSYDQVTERWWQDWTGQGLAPMAVVTADCTLGLDLPVATPGELHRARWFEHHLPFNIDRFAEQLDDEEAAWAREKRRLLDQMGADRDRRRRARAFKRIHAINAALVERHAGLIEAAAQRAERARVGVSNGGVASRRDWFFGLYPSEALLGLGEWVSARLAAAR